MAGIRKEVLDILSNRRNTALNSSRNRTDVLYAAIPVIRDIDNELSKTSLMLFSAGNDKEKFDLIKNRTEELKSRRNSLLVVNGFSSDFDKPVFYCDKCRDTGFIKLEKCSCLCQLEATTVIRTDLAEGLKDNTFDTFSLDYYSSEILPSGKSALDTMSEIYASCLEYAADFGLQSENLLFSGGTGLGKTHLSAAIGHEAAKRGFEVVYDSAQKVTSECRRALFSNAFDCADKYYSCDLLIIDDLGAEIKSEYTVSVLTELINRRLVFGLPMIVTTNLDLAKLKEVYGSRLFSRFIGNFKPFIFAGKDIRYKKL